MFEFGARARILGATVVATAALLSGCGGTSGSHPAAPPDSTTTRPSGSATSSPTSAAHVPTPTTLAHAALASLKQQLDSAGASLGAAGSALAQSDPNQTKDSEGSAP